MVLEIRSYNNRYLELAINLPYSLKQLEPRVREYLSTRMVRGKVEFYLGVTELEDDSEVYVDRGPGARVCQRAGRAEADLGCAGQDRALAHHRPRGGHEEREPQGSGYPVADGPSPAGQGLRRFQRVAHRGGQEDRGRHPPLGRGDPRRRSRWSKRGSPRSRSRSATGFATGSASSWVKGSTSPGCSRRRPCRSCARTSTRKSSA